ncbi:unnamed protein product [Bursaphelenchus okinawaensis]|uniref:Paired domain-containing protein n=1 Tax=Bursaphelenchus okinawaensis TaxID=465554 RepID=A0A811L6D9_9BILA|nr:unnamed protein product [Bursaphelenchus okinawaensis]CAG9117400.1 unnamed protein product [Bursaphelenchus okinawaensis]
MRAAVIKFHNEGNSNSKIAKLLNIPRMTVYRAVKRFEELGHDRDRPKSGRPPSVNTVANRQMIKKRFMRNPRTPVRKMARETGIKETTLRRIVRKNLKMKPYKLKKVQKLTEENKALRFTRCKLLHQRAAGQKCERILFTDEKIFTLYRGLQSPK